MDRPFDPSDEITLTSLLSRAAIHPAFLSREERGLSSLEIGLIVFRTHEVFPSYIAQLISPSQEEIF
jgi:hypothetical protein